MTGTLLGGSFACAWLVGRAWIGTRQPGHRRTMQVQPATTQMSRGTVLNNTATPRTDPAALVDRLDEISASLVEMMAHLAAVPDDQPPALTCVQCAAEAFQAKAAGAEQIPVPNAANVIVAGNSLCFGHIQFTDAPIAPGRTASGLVLPGQGM